MKFTLSTHWNAGRHTTGETLVEEAINLGFDQIELGYDLRPELVPGIKKRMEEGAINVTSVHNYCPVPPTATVGHPELYTLTSTNKSIREAAIYHTTQTIRFAAELGAKIVIIHCGSVEMKDYTRKLIKLYENGKRFSNLYEKTKFDLQLAREKKITRSLTHLVNGLNRLKPALLETGIQLGLENLPYCESIPTESECKFLIKQLGSNCCCYWHDIGHGQIMENLGLASQHHALESLLPVLGGMHIHDVASGIHDHLMPPMGTVDFTTFKKYVKSDIPKVLEPSSSLSPKHVKRGLAFLKEKWDE